jgi:3-hydroxyacyl-CoA dehydrogenase/enoyl-CoA hydratase/3-hydroxybutyryl-CoA epimerase
MTITQLIPHPVYQHWRLETDVHTILWLYFDKKNASVNTINREVMEEFSSIVDILQHDTTYKGVILASAKKSGFIAGADIAQFAQFKDMNEATSLLALGQRILDKWESLKLPTVAMIDGFCLGGGLELALACNYRVVEESAATRIGLPEVKLGIHPGWGGTVRLPRLIGAPQALNLILSGHTVSGRVAAKLGIADAAVPKRQLVHAAKYYILHTPAVHQANPLQAVTNNKLIRQILGYGIRKKLEKKVNPLHYPAPYCALDNWELIGVQGQKAYEREAKSCGKLFFSETCHNLVRVFFLQDRLKNLAKQKTDTLKQVHVIGAGTMGGDIAAWCALQGFTVSLQDLEPRFIAPAIKRAHALFKNKLKENYLVQKAMDQLIPDVQGHGIAKADVIIEAVIEDLAVKQATFKMIEAQAKPQAILATNTSSIPLDEINTVLHNPERLIGIHFFNPVAKMQLVEVVQGKHTRADVIERAMNFVHQLGRFPLPVKSSPGFLVNRILMPYLLESMVLLNEGVPMRAIDKAMVQFGMPMGPITLADKVGLDVCLSVAHYLSHYFHTSVPQRLIDLVAQHQLGVKTGAGFYNYDKQGKPIPSNESSYSGSLDAISNRLVLCMLNEAFACLHEGVVADGDLLDAGMIFGTGFAPFRGGPIHYAKSQGIHELYQQFVEQLHARGQTVEMRAWEEAVV